MTVSAHKTALHLRALAEAKRREGQQRADRLLASVPRAHRRLVERHGARRVWLFGSLVAGLPSAESDVDLAVEGLDASRYFAALADLMEVFHGSVDLVRLEDAPESLRTRVLSEGREL
jgi:predicted nucleotidyltransferase